MTAAQIYSLIENNNCVCVQLHDYGNNKLHEIVETNSQSCNVALERDLPKFSGYRKIKVLAKKGDTNTPWTKAFAWQLEFPADEIKNTSVAAPAVAPGTIGAIEYISMNNTMWEKVFAMQDKNLDIHKQLLEANLKLANQDPSKWLPIITTVAPILGFNSPAAIAGPPQTAGAKTTELHFQDVDPGKLNQQQIGEEIGKVSDALTKKINGSQMLKILIALRDTPDLMNHADKIGVLMNAVSKNPALLDTALKFIPS